MLNKFIIIDKEDACLERETAWAGSIFSSKILVEPAKFHYFKPNEPAQFKEDFYFEVGDKNQRFIFNNEDQEELRKTWLQLLKELNNKPLSIL